MRMRMRMKAAGSATSDSSSDTDSDSSSDAWKNESECSAVVCLPTNLDIAQSFAEFYNIPKNEYAKRRAPT